MTDEKRIVENEERRPCGCVVTTYSDKTAMYAPCVPCGLFKVAENLSMAAQALAAVATRMQAQRPMPRGPLDKIAAKVARGKQ